MSQGSRQPTIYIVLTLMLISYLLFFRSLVEDNIELLFRNIAYSNESTIYNKLEPLTSEVAGTSTSRIVSDLNVLRVAPDIPSTNLITIDARVLAMKKFLLAQNSPLYPYADIFIIEADKYGLDWRLVASISGIESGFGKVIPNNSHNAWGWTDFYTGGFRKFADWREGIAEVTMGLALNYGTNLSPAQIERSYCPPCYEDPNHTWARGVSKNMNDLNYYLNNLDNL